MVILSPVEVVKCYAMDAVMHTFVTICPCPSFRWFLYDMVTRFEWGCCSVIVTLCVVVNYILGLLSGKVCWGLE